MPALDAGPVSRTKTQPVTVPRSVRTQNVRVLTSFKAGKSVPVAAFPLFREDACNVQLRLTLEQMETVELLANAVNFRALAYLVPFSAFDRFFGMDDFNRSYMKAAAPAGQTTPTFIQTAPFLKGSMPVLTTMGIHARENQVVNMAYVEAYNEIWNYRCKNRSPDLEQYKRSTLDASLAPAFWNHQLWASVVPDFDQASIEGAIPLTMPQQRLRVSGIGLNGTAQTQTTSADRQTGGTAGSSPATSGWNVMQGGSLVAGQASVFIKGRAAAPAGFPEIYAELAEAGVTISLANIDVARRTQAFALMRRQYNGLDDDYLIDLLMSGISIPEGDLKFPHLLADRTTVVGMSKRYATTADDLTASVTNGGSFIDLRLRTPRISTGGIVMVLVEVAPEQLFERQADPFMTNLDQATWPEFVRDTLDPEKVDIVHCEDVDIHHATPNTTFGYTYLNEKWNRSRARIGGKFYRPNPDGAFDEDRQRLWAVETTNPTLSKDFYLCGTVHQKPFVDTASDNYELTAMGVASIEGNTVFGRPLIEASDDYNEILDQAPDVPTIPKTGAESAAESGLVEGEDA